MALGDQTKASAGGSTPGRTEVWSSPCSCGERRCGRHVATAGRRVIRSDFANARPGDEVVIGKVGERAHGRRPRRRPRGEEAGGRLAEAQRMNEEGCGEERRRVAVPGVIGHRAIVRRRDPGGLLADGRT